MKGGEGQELKDPILAPPIDTYINVRPHWITFLYLSYVDGIIGIKCSVWDLNQILYVT